MRRLSLLSVLLLALFSPLAHAAIALDTSASNIATTTSLATPITVAAAHETVIIIAMENVSTAPTSVTDSAGTPTNVVTWQGNTSGATRYTGVWIVTNASAGTHTITISNSASVVTAAMVLAYSGLDQTAPFDVTAAISSSAAGSPTASATTPTQAPSAAGELAIAWWLVNSTSSGTTSSAWTNSFVQKVAVGTASPDSMAAADLNTAGSGGLNTTATLSTSRNWSADIMYFKAAGAGATCTHAGQLANGTIAVPVAGSTSVLVPSEGKFDTVDCSTKAYKQPTNGGAIGTN